MSKYTFTFKKDDIFVEFVTTDKDVVERQFQIWVADADDYARNQYKKSKTPTESTVESTPSPENFTNTRTEEVVKEHIEVPQSETVQVVEEPKYEGLAQDNLVEAVTQEQPQEEGEVFEQASSLLKTINTIQNPPEEKVIEEKTVDFEKVLEKSIENPTFEPESSKDQVFLNLISSKNTTDKFHYLMITTYYLSEFEKLDRFSLKQINAKMMQNLMTVIDHSMLQEAINQNFIEVVPDLTGVAEVAEYRLTSVGEEFFAKI